MRKSTHDTRPRKVRRLLGKPFLRKYREPRKYGDPRTSPRLESASERKKRKRAEARNRNLHG